MTVVDASSVVDYLLAGEQSQLADVVAAGGSVLAPELIYLEVAQTVRRLLRRGLISAELAERSIVNLGELRLDTYGHKGLVEVAWEYRYELTMYGACYVALAVLSKRPLVTADPAQAAVARRVLSAGKVRLITST